MWKLAIAQIKHHKVRSALTVLSIGSAIGIVLILSGFELGLYRQSQYLVQQRGAHLFVTQAGIKNFHVVRSSLAQTVRAKIEAIPGVKLAHPITGLWMIYGTENKKMPIFILVYDTLGGPKQIWQGSFPQDREIVLDLAITRQFGLKPGDIFHVSDFDFRISGITRNNSALFSPVGFISYDSMLDFLFESEIAADISAFPLLSFLLVETDRNVSINNIMKDIEKNIDEVDVFTPEQIIKNDVKVGQDMFGPIMSVLIAIAYIVALLIIAIILYSEVAAHRRQFGILKALGFRLIDLVRAVIYQLSIYLLLAFPLGILLAFCIASGIEYFAPVYLVSVLDMQIITYTLVGTIIMSMAGGLLPLRLINEVDPITAFKVE